MVNIVHSVETEAIITFNNGSTYNIPMADPNADGLDNYCTSIKLKEQLYSTNNNNIIGNVCGNTLSLKIQSKDGLLISSNTSSIYHGMMNNTAFIDINCTGDDGVTTYMGRYYVDAWENGVTAATANEVTITCVDLLSRVKNIPLKDLRLKRKLTVREYFSNILNKLNSQLSSDMHINFMTPGADIFNNVDWALWYNNIDRDSFENILNSIAQNTLTHIWIDRGRWLQTDWLLNDSQESPVVTLSGSVNLLDYGTNLADDSKASGVTVNYIENVSYEDKELASISNYNLSAGTNHLSGVKLNTDKILSINTIEIICADGYAFNKQFTNYKDSIDIDIYSTEATTADIKIWGTVINEIKTSQTRYISNDDKSNIIELNNNILRASLIGDYLGGLVNLISYNNSNIYVEGFINPQLKIGDMVTVVGSKLGINNNYKVIGLEFTLGTNYRCKATLLRTV